MLQFGEWKLYRSIFPCSTGTTVIYGTPNRPFGHVLTTRDRLKFIVPNGYQSKINHAFVLKHPDIQVKPCENSLFLITGKIVDVIERFPTHNGFYLVDRNGIPYGDEVYSTNNRSARYLIRRDCSVREGNGSYIGPVVRTYSSGYTHEASRRIYLREPLDNCKVGWLSRTES